MWASMNEEKERFSFFINMFAKTKLKGAGGGGGNRANLLTSDHSAPFQSVKL